MDIDFPLFDNDHLLGDCAMRTIALRLTFVGLKKTIKSACSPTVASTNSY